MAEIIKNVLICDEVITLGSGSSSLNVVEGSDLQSPDSLAIPQNDAEEMLTEIFNESQIESMKKEAYDSGFSDGYDLGASETKKTFAEESEALQLLLEEIPNAMAKHRLTMREEIADMVLAIFQQLFIEQQQNKESIGQQITHALQQINNKQNIELSLHPKDFALLQQGLLDVDFSQFKQLKISPNEDLRLGGCFIKSEHGVFDAGIEKQMDNLKQALLNLKKETICS